MSSCEHAVAAMANLAMESNEIRQQLIDNGIIELIKTLFKQYSNPNQEFAKSIAWILAYIAKNSPDFTLNQAETVSKICIFLLEDEEDEETQVKCMFAFANLCKNPDFIRTVISRGIKPQLVSFLLDPNRAKRRVAFKLLERVCLGREEDVLTILDEPVTRALGQDSLDSILLSLNESTLITGNSPQKH